MLLLKPNFCLAMSVGLVTKYFNTMKQLKRAVMRAAIKRKIPEIVALGLIVEDKYALKAPIMLRAKAQSLIDHKSV